jgi:hypothetical protein
MIFSNGVIAICNHCDFISRYKQLLNRESILRFCDDESNRCLVVPENLKIDSVIPSKLSKGKVLLFVKLRTCALKMENIFSDVSRSLQRTII